VLDLADPVEDEVGYVYEKAAIVKYIRDAERRRPGQPVDCPIAGAPPAAAPPCYNACRCQGGPGDKCSKDQHKCTAGGCAEVQCS
jgi:hypothetical protein